MLLSAHATDILTTSTTCIARIHVCTHPHKPQILGHLRDSHWFFFVQPLDSRSKRGNQQNNCSFPALLDSSVIERKFCRQTGKQTYTDKQEDKDTDWQTNRQMRRIIVNFLLWSWQVDRHCGTRTVNFLCSSQLKKQTQRKINEITGMECHYWYLSETKDMHYKPSSVSTSKALKSIDICYEGSRGLTSLLGWNLGES